MQIISSIQIRVKNALYYGSRLCHYGFVGDLGWLIVYDEFERFNEVPHFRQLIYYVFEMTWCQLPFYYWREFVTIIVSHQSVL